MNQMTRRDAIVYWLTTSAVCGVMAFSAVNFNLKEPFGPMKGAFVHLGYPSYFRIELTVAKVLGLLALLSSDIVMHTDGGGKASALLLPIFGSDKVARAMVFGLAKLVALRPQPRIIDVNGMPGIVSYVNGRPQSVFTFEVDGTGLISAIYIVTNPDKLTHLPPPPF